MSKEYIATPSKTIEITRDMITLTSGGNVINDYVLTGHANNWKIEYTFTSQDKSGKVNVNIADIKGYTEELTDETVTFTNGGETGEGSGEEPGCRGLCGASGPDPPPAAQA